MRIQFVFYLLLAVFSLPSFTHAAEGDVWKILDKIPVQHAGRMKPFQSFAEETARLVVGTTQYENYGATELMWRWMAEPDQWNTTAMIPVDYRPIREEFGVMLIDHKVSPEIALQHTPFTSKVQEAIAKRQKKELLTPLERERISLYEKAIQFKDVATGAAPGLFANPEDPRVGWLALDAFGTIEGQRALGQSYAYEDAVLVEQAVRNFLLSFKEPAGPTQELALEIRESLHRLAESRGVLLDQKMIRTELHYNQLQPEGLAWKFYALSVFLFLILGFQNKKSKNHSIFKWSALAVFGAGFLIHTYGFYLRCVIAGRPPVSNMYESIIWVSWAVAFFSLIIYAVYRSEMILVTAGLVSLLALVIAESFPVVLNPAISPLVPVLRSTLWLTVHVLTITLSYGAFALAWGLGHALVFGYAFSPEKKERLKNLAQYTYRAIQIGVILLASGTVLGGVWANYSWGRFWGWDPKETWALIALLGYVAVLHGRLTGWIRTFGFAVGAVASFLLVVMAWYGVNFVLAAGLHSYGFGGGGAPYVLAVCLLDLALIGWASWVYKKRQKSAHLAQKMG